MDRSKKLACSIVHIAFALFAILFLSANFIECTTEYKIGLGTYQEYASPEKIMGWETLALGDFGISGYLVSALQIIELILAVLMIVEGILGIIEASTGNSISILKKTNGKRADLLEVYFLVQFLLFLFFLLLMMTNDHTRSTRLDGYTYMYFKDEASLAAGPYVMIGASTVATLICSSIKRNGASEATEYICSGCGAKSAEGIKFCALCGKEIVKVEKTAEPETAAETTDTVDEYVCSGCGAKSAEGIKFCALCGKEIVKVEKTAEPEKAAETTDIVDEYVCSGCGAKLDEGANFCRICGMKIEK